MQELSLNLFLPLLGGGACVQVPPMPTQEKTVTPQRLIQRPQLGAFFFGA